MSERNYDQGVADGVRSTAPAMRELSKQIVDLRAELEAAEEAPSNVGFYAEQARHTVEKATYRIKRARATSIEGSG